MTSDVHCRYYRFQHHLYDWSGFDPVQAGYNIIRIGKPGSESRINGKYFTVLSYSTPEQVQRYERLSKLPTRALVKYKRHRIVSFYARATVRVNGERTATVMLQRLILGLDYGNELVGDHINSVGLDNRDVNLRIFTDEQNQANKLRNGLEGQLAFEHPLLQQDRDRVPPIIFPPLVKNES